jgi:RNA-directed DNA polymerase
VGWRPTPRIGNPSFLAHRPLGVQAFRNRAKVQLLKFSWFKVARHELVRGTASPDDPGLREYWWERRRVNIRHLTLSDVKLADAQDWYCPMCGMDLINGEELHRHHRKPRADGGPDSYSNRELVHLYCHQQVHARRQRANKCPADE